MNKLPFMIQKRFVAYGIFLLLGAFATLGVLLSSPSDPKNAILFGFSLERLLLGTGLLAIGLALLFLIFKLSRNPETSKQLWERFFQPGEQSKLTLWVAAILFLFLWISLFLPSYRLGGLASYVSRLQPILIWLALTCAVTAGLVILERRTFTDSKTTVRAGLVALLILSLLALVVVWTGIGIQFPADYWYGAGVPVLGLQVLFSILAGVLFAFVEKKLETVFRGHSDLFLFIFIWIIAAWFWGRTPLSPNYFMPDTSNNTIYPYSDGATFDTGSQYALIGQGLFNSRFFDRVLYSMLLVYLHRFFGQDFTILMTAQAALFAIFPAIIYLIGKELHGRTLGITAGTLMAARGVTAIIVSKWIDTASPKMILTDFPTAIGIAIFLYCVLKWTKNPTRINWLIGTGAVFGFSLSVRSHVLTLLPVVLIFLPFVLKWNWKQIMLAGLLVALGIFASTLPWELRNQSKGIPMYYAYYFRIEFLLRERYGIGSGAVLPMDPDNASIDIRRDDSRAKLSLQTAQPSCTNAVCSIANHFVHNVLTTFVVLPTTFRLEDAWNTVKADTPYWKQYWKGSHIDGMASVLHFINLVLISLGFGMIWNKSRKYTLLPVLFLVTFLMTNSLGLTSGGRYVSPVDWILCLFFIAGGLQAALWIFGITETGNNEQDELQVSNPVIKPNIKMLPVLLMVLGISALMPLSEVLAKPRYQVQTPDQILSRLESTGILDQSGYSRDELTSFLSQPNAIIREGRALYPRYYRTGEGEQDRSTYYRFLDYQRMVFTLISPYSSYSEGVVIPGDPPTFPVHAEDVVVLGCWNTTYYAPFIDAVVVFVNSGEGHVYNRAPGSPLTCPLQTP